MANTSSTAKRPADKQDATSSASLVHQEQVNEVVVGFFDDKRATVQRRYRKPDGKTGYANSLRPNHWKDARLALEQFTLADRYPQRAATDGVLRVELRKDYELLTT